MNTCSVEGCGRKRYGLGYCKMHHGRSVSGRPMDGPSRNKFASPAILEWMDAMQFFDSEECLPWPFHRTVGNGYARFGNRSAANIMCEKAHGPSPEGKPFTRHLCGKGHEACVNPRHLTWGDRSENERDKERDGTSNQGSGNGHAKLTVEQVRYIRATAGEVRGAELARRFRVSHHAISHVRSGRTWKLDRGSPIAPG